MKRRFFLLFSIFAAALAAGVWLVSEKPSTAVPVELSATHDTANSREALLPLPPVPELSPEKVELGRRLFFEKRLSRDNSMSCASCHDLSRSGTDRSQFPIGINGQTGVVNAPSIFNVSLNFVQFWDGRAASLEEQAAGPVHNPIEMASSWEEVSFKLGKDETYREAFRQLYPQGITGAAIVDAIATFERTLLTPNSRFDRYLRGDSSALDTLERTGYRRFLDYGCASCHQGANIGGNMFQRFGVMGDYFSERQPVKADLGRFNVTGREEDRHVFKVPSLRNVAETPPYFHNGSTRSLDEAVIIMGRYQLGRELPDADIKAIVAFLRTLTGTWQGQAPQ
ncbi:MAG: cytochrome-c peroxidase [Sulfuricellaceae bacterium]|nr:cytochrome-c peroxidase [Sulfuricellaceae bacterium]